MKREKEGHEKAMNANAKELITTALVLVAVVSSAPLTLAAELTIEPSVNVVPGTLINITGTGFNSSETVLITTTVTCYKPVSDGRCECTMQNFFLPANISLKLSVRRVTDNVSIYIKKGFWWKISPGLTSFFQFEYNPATYTSNVTSGKVPESLADTYSIDVIGDVVSGDVNCTMVTSAELPVEADADGNFSLTFDTRGIPLCNFTINATGKTSGYSAGATMNILLNGDASMDGRVNAYDCVCIARYVVGIPGYDATTISLSAADVDGIPGVQITDAQHLAKYLVGLVTELY